MWIKIELYFMSLSLLFFLLIIKSINIPIYTYRFQLGIRWMGWEYLLYKNIPTIICLICLLGSMLCKKRFLNSLKGNKDLPCTIEKIKNANYEYLTFLTTYIIPLICFDLGIIRDCLLLFVLLVLLGLLFIKTNLYYQNPSLALMGFNIYAADIGYKNSIISDIIIISRVKIKKGDVIYKHDIENTEVIYCAEKKIKYL